VRDKTGVTKSKGFDGIWLISGGRTGFSFHHKLLLYEAETKVKRWSRKPKGNRGKASIRRSNFHMAHLRALEVNHFEPQFILIF